MRRSTIILTAVTLLTSVCSASVSNAAFFSLPRMLGVQYQKLQRMSFETPVLAPMGHVRFCLQTLKIVRLKKPISAVVTSP